MDLKINDEQSKNLLAAPLSHRSEKQVQTDDDMFITLTEKNLGDSLVQTSIQHRETYCWCILNRRESLKDALKKGGNSFSQRRTLKH